MNKKIITIIVLIVLLAVFAFFIDKTNTERKEANVNQENTEEENNFLLPLPVKYQYKEGVHTFVGNIELPSTCYNYNASIDDTERENEKNIVINYERNEDADICAQVITNATYKVSYEGDEDVKFNAFVNGEEKRLNIFEIPLDQDIDDFELFIKG